MLESTWIAAASVAVLPTNRPRPLPRIPYALAKLCARNLRLLKLTCPGLDDAVPADAAALIALSANDVGLVSVKGTLAPATAAALVGAAPPPEGHVLRQRAALRLLSQASGSEGTFEPAKLGGQSRLVSIDLSPHCPQCGGKGFCSCTWHCDCCGGYTAIKGKRSGYCARCGVTRFESTTHKDDVNDGSSNKLKSGRDIGAFVTQQWGTLHHVRDGREKGVRDDVEQTRIENDADWARFTATANAERARQATALALAREARWAAHREACQRRAIVASRPARGVADLRSSLGLRRTIDRGAASWGGGGA